MPATKRIFSDLQLTSESAPPLPPPKRQRRYCVSSKVLPNYSDHEQFLALFKCIDEAGMVRQLNVCDAITKEIAEFTTGNVDRCANCTELICWMHQSIDGSPNSNNSDDAEYDEDHAKLKHCFVSDRFYCAQCIPLTRTAEDCSCEKCGELCIPTKTCSECRTPIVECECYSSYRAANRAKCTKCQQSKFMCDICYENRDGLPGSQPCVGTPGARCDARLCVEGEDEDGSIALCMCKECYSKTSKVCVECEGTVNMHWEQKLCHLSELYSELGCSGECFKCQAIVCVDCLECRRSRYRCAGCSNAFCGKCCVYQEEFDGCICEKCDAAAVTCGGCRTHRALSICKSKCWSRGCNARLCSGCIQSAHLGSSQTSGNHVGLYCAKHMRVGLKKQ